MLGAAEWPKESDADASPAVRARPSTKKILRDAWTCELGTKITYPREHHSPDTCVRASARRFPIIGTDFFQTGSGIWQAAGGPAATGVYDSMFGVPNAQLPAAHAIARSRGTRASVLRQLFATNIRNGILGRIRFNRYGELVTGPITILRLHAGWHAVPDPSFVNTVVDRIITPPPETVP